ncbi:hypothetical protein MRB53_019429 [Persea americana]|uniref:Uncharacterized protein n=1 Tax=Persea americana TaxID=3435 RepID=A0ACC2KYD4_PERAE|nr:hypothetical protein MRB53_019429 [Persea americana]
MATNGKMMIKDFGAKMGQKGNDDGIGKTRLSVHRRLSRSLTLDEQRCQRGFYAKLVAMTISNTNSYLVYINARNKDKGYVTKWKHVVAGFDVSGAWTDTIDAWRDLDRRIQNRSSGNESETTSRETRDGVHMRYYSYINVVMG